MHSVLLNTFTSEKFEFLQNSATAPGYPNRRPGPPPRYLHPGSPPFPAKTRFITKARPPLEGQDSRITIQRPRSLRIQLNFNALRQKNQKRIDPPGATVINARCPLINCSP
jgi:hypothetical protein